MIVLWFLLGVVWAGQWAPPQPLVRLVDETGHWVLPGGAPALLAVDPPGSLVDVEDADGARVKLLGYGDGLLVAAGATSRRLQVIADADVRVTVRLLERDDDDGDWLHYERDVLLLLADDDPDGIGLPPNGSERLAAELRLRRRALTEEQVVLLGAVRDLSLVRPIGGGAHAFERVAQGASVPGTAATFTVRGPGLVTWIAQPREDGFHRFDVQVSLDGRVVERIPLAGTGTARRAERFFVPPGTFELGLGSDEVAVGFEVRRRRLQSPLGRPWPRDVTETAGLDEAERRYVSHERGADEMFRFHTQRGGAAGELARARLVRLSNDPFEREQLVGTLDDWSPDGVELLCDAILASPEGLDPVLVQAVVLRAADPDLERLALWMDDLGGRRPRGQALLANAVPAVPDDPALARAATRTASLGTRWSRLWPTSAAGPGLLLRTPEGPGIKRVAIDDRANIFMPTLLGERWPTITLRTDGPATFDLDAHHYTVPYTSEIEIALPPEGSTLEVVEGTVYAMNPKLVEGGRPVFEWLYADLPATYALPDAGAPTEVAVLAERPAAVTVAFDDGRVALLESGSGRVTAGPWARSFTLEGPDGTRAAAMVRIPLAADKAPRPGDPTGPASEAEALLQIRESTLAVDDGYLEERIPRAEALAALGRVTDARRDLTIAEQDPLLAGAARKLRAQIARQNPSASDPGPVSIDAALAAAGIDVGPAPRTPGEEAAWLRDLARAHPDARPLLRLAIDRSMMVGDTLEAARLAWTMQETSRMERMVRLTPWRAVGRADTRTGLVPVVQTIQPDPAPPLWKRIDAALVASPFRDIETVELREGESDLVQLPGSRLTAELFCRDLRLARRPCTTRIRVGDTVRALQVLDGQTMPVTLVDGLYRAHTVEVAGPQAEQVLVVRLTADGVVQPPRVERLALSLPGRPVRLTVAGDALLEVDTLDGAVEITVDGAPVSGFVRGTRTTIWLDGAGPRVVGLTGSGRAFVRRGLPRAPPGPPEPPPRSPASDVPVLDPTELLARFGPQPIAVLPEVGGFGTMRVGAGLLRDTDGRDQVPYTATEVFAEYLRAGDTLWVRTGPWIRGPLGAAGLLADTGAGWRSGLVGVRGEGAVGAFGVARSWQLTLRARQDLRFHPRWRFRLEGRAFAGQWSLPPADPVDARAWSLYRLAHPQGLAFLPSFVWRPTRDLRAQAGATLFTNPDLSLDTVGADVDVDWLVWRYTILKFDVGLRRALADADRAEAQWRPLVGVGLDHAPWVHRNHRLQIQPRLFVTRLPIVFEGRLSVSWMYSPGRGLRDLAPDAESFRSSRGALP